RGGAGAAAGAARRAAEPARRVRRRRRRVGGAAAAGGALLRAVPGAVPRHGAVARGPDVPERAVVREPGHDAAVRPAHAQRRRRAARDPRRGGAQGRPLAQPVRAGVRRQAPGRGRAAAPDARVAARAAGAGACGRRRLCARAGPLPVAGRAVPDGAAHRGARALHALSGSGAARGRLCAGARRRRARAVRAGAQRRPGRRRGAPGRLPAGRQAGAGVCRRVRADGPHAGCQRAPHPPLQRRRLPQDGPQHPGAAAEPHQHCAARGGRARRRAPLLRAVRPGRRRHPPPHCRARRRVRARRLPPHAGLCVQRQRRRRRAEPRPRQQPARGEPGRPVRGPRAAPARAAGRAAHPGAQV
ncbi:hypothetical protein H4S02_007671, partial [Coemansia sp. RSA 2611]